MEEEAESDVSEKSPESGVSVDNEEALEAEVAVLENKISENIFDYQSHVDLISALKKLVDLDRLRVARNRMAEQFPLAPNLWVDWLQDEVKVATSPEEKQSLVELFERAVKDYISVEVWLEYVQFSIGLQSSEKGSNFEEIRSTFERSLTASGLHVSKGSLLWEAFIEFEVVILGMLKDKPEEWQNQAKRVANLFKRQLSCPLLDTNDTFERFNMWLEDTAGSSSCTIIDKNVVENIYIKSKEKLSKIEPFEEKLLSDAENLMSTYAEYLDHEKSKAGSPVRVQCLYERAVCDLCLNDSLWSEYIDYVRNVLDDCQTVLSITKRAIRNCPWSSQLYQSYFTSLEKYSQPHEAITEVMEQALTSGLQSSTDYRDLWMRYLEYLRRRFDALDIAKEEEEKRIQDLILAFGKATEFLSQLQDADVEGTVAQFWARIEAIYCKNMEKTRSLWSQILQEERNKTAEMWLEYINLERAYGDSKHLRKLFPRALQSTKDWPETVAKVWLNYERDEGTLESYLGCVNKIKSRIQQINEQRLKLAKLAEPEKNFQPAQKRSKRPGLGFKENNKHTWTRNKDSNLESKNECEGKKLTGYKRKVEDKEKEKDEVSPAKKPKGEEKESSQDIVEKLLSETEKGKESGHCSDHGVSVSHDPSKDDRTVFLSNLDFSIEETVIRELFSACGNITDLRLVKDYKGRSKGYCYVEFETAKEAAKALTKDREAIEGRPVFVSKCDPDKTTRGSGFKYSSRLEKNKLFVKGLPFSIKESDLKELFGKFGDLKDVRLVTFRNGHSKGIAYVEFEDEVSATQAIIKTDGMKLSDKEISVAMSHPPERKTESAFSQIVSLGGGPKESGPRGRGRTQLFLPRSVHLNQESTATSSMANLSIASPTSVISEQNKKLSNSDFRNLIK